MRQRQRQRVSRIHAGGERDGEGACTDRARQRELRHHGEQEPDTGLTHPETKRQSEDETFRKRGGKKRGGPK